MRQVLSKHGFILAYGAAHGGKSLFWHAGELLFAYFLTEACGLPPRQMGYILGGSLIFGAVTDLVLGRGLNRRVRSTAAAGKVQFLGALLSGSAFCVFGFAGFVAQGPARVVFALAALIVFRGSYSVLDNPQNAMLALATRDDAERAQLASIRYIFGGLANIAVALAFTPIFRVGNAQAHIGRFALFTAFLSLACIASSGWLWRFLVRSQRAFGASFSAPSPFLIPQPRVRALVYRPWSIVLMLFIVSLGTSIFGRLEPYFAAYGARSDMQGSLFLTSVAAGNLVSQPFWSCLARRFSLLATLRGSAVFLVLATLAFGFLGPRGVMGAAVGGGLYGWGCGGTFMSLWALAAAAGQRKQMATTLFGVLTCASKLALALAAIGVAELLAGTSYHSIGGMAANGWLPSMIAAPVLASLLILLFGTCLVHQSSVAEERSRPLWS